MRTSNLLFLVGLISMAGCSAKLVNEYDTDNFAAPKGIPWVESREYDVFVYNLHLVNGTASAKPLHYGRYALSDKVNGKVIDSDRDKWTTNYKGEAFSAGTLNLSFHENGSLKKGHITTQPGTANALSASTELLNLSDSIDEKEVKRLENEKKLRDLRKELDSTE